MRLYTKVDKSVKKLGVVLAGTLLAFCGYAALDAVNTPTSLVAPVGTTSQTIGSKTSALNVYSNSSTAAASIGRWQANSNGSDFQCLKSRNATVGSFTTVQAGDEICTFSAHADDGSTYNTQVGKMLFKATGTISTGIVPGQFVLILNDSSGNQATIFSCTATGCTGAQQAFPQTYTATYDPASLTAATQRADSVTVTGITTAGGAVSANPGTTPAAGCIIASVRASGADTVSVTWQNSNAVAACDTASSTWKFTQAQ